jgi:histidinol-phosphate aminotransferase
MQNIDWTKMQNKFKTMQVIRPDVKAMHAYVVQDSKGFVKLDAMENPYTLNDSLQAELGKRLGSVAVNRYPGQRIHDLQNALAQYCNLPENYALILGN